ncbi:MAG: TIGR03067 domain-containing protein [Pirellulales bacterium]
MLNVVLKSLVVFSLFACPSIAFAEDASPKTKLLGVWQAISLKFGDKEAPPEAVKLMRFTFRENELLLRGNFQDAREVSCSYKFDSSKAPMELDFTPPQNAPTILGIARFQGDKLELCLRRAAQNKARPAEFKTGGDETVLLVQFERVADK